jgi:GrpB-like predicted nucleotidyltransferase (UPF0157 family)
MSARRLHVALAVRDLGASVRDYTDRLGEPPCCMVEGAYALWRTDHVNLSISVTPTVAGPLRHLGFEDSEATTMSVKTDVNGIEWEHFTEGQQRSEILEHWPHARFRDSEGANDVTTPPAAPARTRRIVIADYDPSWPATFAGLARDIRAVLGEHALRIDHIGSTSIPGLAAKPVIDIQVSVRRIANDEPWMSALIAAGWRWDAHNSDQTKRMFGGPPGAPALHLHVREVGSLTQQQALVFRDYLRAQPDAAKRYEAFKRKLSERLWIDGNEYADAKTEIVWPLLHEATLWSMRTGWRAEP